MAEEDQRAAREADVAGGDRREAERGEGSNDSRHEQMDSCICSEGIRFLEMCARRLGRRAARVPSHGSSVHTHLPLTDAEANSRRKQNMMETESRPNSE